MDITGKIHQIKEPTFGSSAKGDWTSQDVIIQTEGDYPKFVCLNFFNKGEMTSRLVQGQNIKAHINVESRESNGKWYTSARVWKVE